LNDSNFKHIPVLLNECIETLNVREGNVYVDGTLGGAGHSYCIAKLLNNTGKLIGIDRDSEAMSVARNKLKDFTNIIYVNDNHDNIKEILQNIGIEGVDGILLDLGVSSYQIDEKNRGFSYKEDTKLDMRMDTTQELTAEIVVNTYEEETLANIMFEYGEEKFSRRIASNICKYRQNKKIETTRELAKIVNDSLPRFIKERSIPRKKSVSGNTNRSEQRDRTII
jgi:16S rRNA (cytosine1402-N4)-methyltransferase